MEIFDTSVYDEKIEPASRIRYYILQFNELEKNKSSIVWAEAGGGGRRGPVSRIRTCPDGVKSD